MEFTLIRQVDMGDRELIVVDCVGPASYTTGGEALAPTDLPFRCQTGIDHVQGQDATGLRAVWDWENEKLLFLDADGAEETALDDLSVNTYRLQILGR